MGIKHTHSSCNDLSIAGILVAEGGLGFTSAEAEIWIKLKVQKLTILNTYINMKLLKYVFSNSH